MGWRVYSEVFDHSKQKGGSLLILLAIAETAHNEDAVAFGLEQGWPKKDERNARKKRETIAGKARLSPDSVSKLIKELVREDELELRSVQHGRAQTYVYRITLGIYRDLEADAERLERYGQYLDRPFSTPEELALPWPERPANFSGGRTTEPPAEMSGGRSGDYLASEQQPPDNFAGDDLTSTGPDTPGPARAKVQHQGPNPSLTEDGDEDQSPSSVSAGADEQAETSSTKELVRAFARKLDRWPETRTEWGAWMKAFTPLADAGVTPSELEHACESYLEFHRKFGRTVDLSPFGLTKHWQVISQALEQRFLVWARWATDTSWRLPDDEVEWQLERAALRISDGDVAEIRALAKRARAAHTLVDDEVLRWVEAKGWALADDTWRRELAEQLPRAGAAELRRAANHRRHELRQALARLSAGLPPARSEAA